ncbi:hypothetical protein IJG10_00750, partial [Candidatus Saccharibacteria bacterium]|nr:hypothetical protein [Candidatus Saccharibacteria bacterium]
IYNIYYMKRFKITPEVIIKSSLSFLFGALVGFFAFRLVTKFSPNFVAAIDEAAVFASPEKSPEKTEFPLKLEKASQESRLKNESEPLNLVFRNAPVLKVEPPAEPEPVEVSPVSVSEPESTPETPENPEVEETPPLDELK